MKVSSASKKVLASALSAAMVVAFAPTVALADLDANDKVTIKFDTTGYQVASGSSAIASELEAGSNLVTVGDDNKITISESVFKGHNYVDAQGTAVDGWYAEIDGKDGYSKGDIPISTDGSATDFSGAKGAVVNGATITLKPYKTTTKEVTVGAEYDAANKVYKPITVAQKADAGKAAVEGIAAQAKKGTYRVSLTKAGVSDPIYNDIVNVANDQTSAEAVALNFKDGSTNGIDTKAWGTGDYELTYTNALTGKTAASYKFSIVDVTVKGVYDSGNGVYKANQSFLAVAGQTYASQLTNAGIVNPVKEEPKSSAQAEAAKALVVNGAEVATYEGSAWANVGEAKVAAGDVVSAVYQRVLGAKLSYDAQSSKLELNIVNATASEYASDTFKYTVSGPSITPKEETATNGAAEYTFGSNGAQPGTYTVAVTRTYKAGEADKTVEVGTAKVQLTKVTFDAGTYGDASETSYVVQNDGKSNAYDLAKATVTNKTEYSTGYKFCGWSLDGSKLVTTADKVAADATEVAFKAVWHTPAAAADDTYNVGYTYANKQITLNAGKDGYKVYYVANPSSAPASVDATNGTEYTGPIVADPTATNPVTIYAQAQPTTVGAKSSAVLKLTSTYSEAKDLKDWGDTVLAVKTSDSTAAAPKYYSESIGTAAGKATVESLGYASDEDTAAAVLAQKKSLIAQVAAYEKAIVAAYGAGVTNENGSVTKASASQVDKATKAIDQVLSDLEVVTTAASKQDVKKTAGKYGTSQAKLDAGAYATSFSADNAKDLDAAITAAVSELIDGATTYAKTDVDAAAAFDAAVAGLVKAEDVTEENYEQALAGAEQAQASYDALTGAQKELISADVSAIAKTQVAALKAQYSVADKALEEAKKAAADAKTAQEQAEADKAVAEAAQAVAEAKAEAAEAAQKQAEADKAAAEQAAADAKSAQEVAEANEAAAKSC